MVGSVLVIEQIPSGEDHKNHRPYFMGNNDYRLHWRRNRIFLATRMVALDGDPFGGYRYNCAFPHMEGPKVKTHALHSGTNLECRHHYRSIGSIIAIDRGYWRMTETTQQ